MNPLMQLVDYINAMVLWGVVLVMLYFTADVLARIWSNK